MQSIHKEYMLVTADSALVQRLNELAPQGMHWRAVPPTVECLRQAWPGTGLTHVFFDFSTAQLSTQMGALVREFHQWDMSCRRVAIGCSDSAQIVLDALRAGVHEFIDLSQPDRIASELLRITEQGSQASQPMVRNYPHVMLLGARAGIGTSSLAASLAYLVQVHINQHAPRAHGEISNLPLHERACLVDLGWPIGNASLYLTLSGDFTFIQAASERHRLDNTMLSAALAQHPSGLNALSLPSDPYSLQQLNIADAVSLCAYLRSTMASVVIDGGGFPNERVLQELEAPEDELLVLVDQSLSSLVALSDLLARRAEQSLTKRPKLIVNQYDSRYGLAAEAIAKRFDLELLAVLPDRRMEHLRSASMGQLLVQAREKDSYSRAVQALRDTLLSSHRTLSPPGGSSFWGSLKTKWGAVKPRKNKVTV
ncbi:pilus assembly protein CpaF [Alcaligenes endophyticus]|uniref:Pilus assembly protein CpaF n=1 Tax=Alcaligenes endophyticus TaxID=1929088 RepID=A0ABT8EHE9_9BURK|nr:pilus assembly protein CpaF [Alcaligenes endophyticus]MCX5592050.1 pilus assembly protein CpaF [Alcaligenes endophyticus]MDN4120697.1 pilus assembly protein CpaF [Alcaligenes endophyticus]